jgi:hypothetical protein
MSVRVGQQTGWVQLGDVAIAFVFPVHVQQADESESEKIAGQHSAACGIEALD